ncbi:HIT domain-containing protein [Parvularcula flava]|uniref:HIT domain-containing protein n=1 Tax=Aquisalinus luteolus TaxID=1566827 RepID=A0A8J3A635_9PROT|nr:HIT family protein [Aquisalinus luteolus]NHK29259.1 HIT domain-containing protein [Aquisalinus luteolus]GGI01319.1 hypothetical protein GCM10011355_31680 [Aquisalinus luteolus]
MARFELHERLNADTLPGGVLQLCMLRVMDDARFDWIVMVPRRTGLTELHDLLPPQRAILMEEISGVSERLKAATGARKINVAMFGNMVPQLHIHVIARHEDDPAWPGGAVGFGTREPMDDAARKEKLDRLMPVLRPGLNTGAPSALF